MSHMEPINMYTLRGGCIFTVKSCLRVGITTLIFSNCFLCFLNSPLLKLRNLRDGPKMGMWRVVYSDDEGFKKA